MFDKIIELKEEDLGNYFEWLNEENKTYTESTKEEIDFLDRETYEWIGQLKGVGQKVKKCLRRLNELSAKINLNIIRVGRIIIKSLKSFIKTFISLFPSLTTGIAIGLFLSFLVSKIPFVGTLIFPIFGKTVIPSFGVIGVVNDFPGLIKAVVSGDVAKALIRFFEEESLIWTGASL